MRDMFRLKFSIRQSADGSDTAELMLWGEIVQDYGKFYKEVFPDDKTSADFKKVVDDIVQKGAKKLLLRINSPGGIVTESIAMRSILANAGFEEITVRIEGLCASAATNIATIPGAHVQIAEGSEYMIHNPWTYARGFAEDLEHAAERLRNMEKTSRGFYCARSGQSDEQVKEWMDKETWFTAEDAVKYGFADELLKAEAENAEPAAACVSAEEMAAMMSLYREVPKCIAVREKKAESETAKDSQSGMNASPAAGETSANTTKEEPEPMELNELTKEQLTSGNPALAEEIARQAVEAERERVSGIDAVTMTGYEQDAEEAKRSGMSVADFIRSMVQKSGEKKKSFIAARQVETAPAKQVTAGAAEDSDGEDPKAKSDKVAKELAMLADGMNVHADGMY